MGLSDSPRGPACPSRASGWVTHPPLGVSRVAAFFLLRHAVVITPVGSQAAVLLAGEFCDRGLPHPFAGSAPTLPVSRPARRSFALRPVGSLNRPRRPFYTEGFSRRVAADNCSDCFRLEQPLAGWDSHPLKNTTFHDAQRGQVNHCAAGGPPTARELNAIVFKVFPFAVKWSVRRGPWPF